MLISCLVPASLQEDVEQLNDFDYYYLANLDSVAKLTRAEKSFKDGRPALVDFWSCVGFRYDWMEHFYNFFDAQRSEFGLVNFPKGRRIGDGAFNIWTLKFDFKNLRVMYIDALINLVQRSKEGDLIQLDLIPGPKETKESTRVEIFKILKKMMNEALIPHRKFHLNEIADLSKLEYWNKEELVHSLVTTIPTQVALRDQRLTNATDQLICDIVNMEWDPIMFSRAQIDDQRKGLVLSNIKVFKKMAMGKQVNQADYTE